MSNKMLLSLATVALFSATASAYEGVETKHWFSATQDGSWNNMSRGSAIWSEGVLEVDTAIDDQYVYSASETPTADGYRVTADVTFVRSATAMNGSAPTLSSGAPLAALAATGESWYGVAGGTWVALSGLTPPNDDITRYSVVFDFKTNGVTKVVRYTVDGTVLTNASGVAEFTCARQDANVAKVAVAGYGTFENIKGVTASYINIAVADVTGYDESTATEQQKATYAALTKAGWTSTSGKTAEEFLSDTGANGKSNWVNYALGLNSTDANAQPFAAPVQTSDANELSFSLGGVDLASIAASGVAVTFTVESADAPDAETWTPGNSAGANGTATAAVPTSGVKYYRIKVTIQK